MSFSLVCALSSAASWQNSPANQEVGMDLFISQRVEPAGVVLERHLSVKAAAEHFGYDEQYLALHSRLLLSQAPLCMRR
jgi:hypothetical protein